MARDAVNAKDLALHVVVSRAVTMEIREGCGVDAKTKFLAAKALHGVVGLVFVAHGSRFANEFGRRDSVTGEMTKNKPLFRLALNKATSDDIAWHCTHYIARGVMKFTSLEQLWPRTVECLLRRWRNQSRTTTRASLKTAQTLLEDRSQRILAASLGTKLLARRVQEVLPRRHFGSRFHSTALPCRDHHSTWWSG